MSNFKIEKLPLLKNRLYFIIRFNPDKYYENNKIKNPTIATRLPILKKEVEKQIKRIENNENTELLETIYLYYDK